MISPQYVQNTIQSLALLKQLVNNVLERGVDFGRTPGTPSDGLWDPGAQSIVSSFNCHFGTRRILHLIDSEDKISVVIEVPVISNVTGNEVGSGIGASTTNEANKKYRWVFNPQDWGYDEESIKTLKTKTEDGELKYRITNPERSEMLHVIMKAASKRAEVDAAESMPGAASALRALFHPDRAQGNRRRESRPLRETSDTELVDESPRWTQFWSATKALGLEPSQVHTLLGAPSMKEWLKAGKSLDDAIKVLSEKLSTNSQQATVPPEATRQPPAEQEPPKEKSPDELRAMQFKNPGEFYTACLNHLKLLKSKVDKEISMYDLNKPDQRKAAWVELIAVYGDLPK